MDDHSFEDELEPRHLIDRADVVLRAGVLMLGAGTSSLRVRELMRRAARAVGLDQMAASISYTTIVATVARRGIFRTRVAETGTPGVNAHRIAMLQDLSLRMPQRLTDSQLAARLDRIERTAPLYPLWLQALLVALACCSVTVLQHGGWREVLAVGPASAAAFLLAKFLARHSINHLASIVVCSATSSALFIALTTVMNAILGDASPRMPAGFICASVFLIPGFPLVTGGLDLTRIDLNAGVPRVTYAAMSLLAITIGVWTVASLASVTPGSPPGFLLPAPAAWGIGMAAGFVAVFGWATMFNAPVKVALAAGLVAVAGKGVGLAVTAVGGPAHVATFAGCTVMGLLCALVGALFRLEKIIMTVPTLLVFVPGSTALQTMLLFNAGDVGGAVADAITTVLTVIAMVAGLAAARMLTDPEWTFTRTDAPSLVSLVRNVRPTVRRTRRSRRRPG